MLTVICPGVYSTANSTTHSSCATLSCTGLANAETMAVSGVTKTLTLLRILAIILFALLCSAVAGGLAVTRRRKQAVHYLSWSTGTMFHTFVES